jgi:N-acetylmuramoyl-L-alanine amidase
MIKIQYSQNFSKKIRKNKDIKLLVIHYTGMQSKIASVKRLLNSKSKVSCHYLIDRKGQIIKMVEENKIAWHAGKSRWKNFSNLNDISIGIELVNRGHKFGYEKFTNLQINQLINLCLKLKKKYKIKPSNIVGHSDIAPLRKEDPGEKFPWKKLKNKKLGIWYENSKFKLSKIDRKKLRNLFFINLHKIGYRYFNVKKETKNDVYLVKAFKRRFLPKNMNGIIDQKTYIISDFLANKVKI